MKNYDRTILDDLPEDAVPIMFVDRRFMEKIFDLPSEDRREVNDIIEKNIGGMMDELQDFLSGNNNLDEEIL